MRSASTIAIFVLLLSMQAHAQDSTKKERNWELAGYVVTMHSLIPLVGTDRIMLDNLFHNRLNFRWFPSDKFSTVIEARNRLFYGEFVRSIPNYGRFIDTNDDQWWLSWRPVDERSVVAHTMLDRAYAQWTWNKVELRAGRQRVNWGINSVWNPNDLFNAFNYFDFDHAERPGSDAVRLTWYYGATSSLEFASKVTDDPDEMVAAALWKFNRKQYDYQLLGGISGKDIALGGGWAGNLKNAGFKGEVGYFHNYEALADTAGEVTATASIDYVFKGNVYASAGLLFNSAGEERPGAASIINVEISAKNPFPYRYTTFYSVNVPITPLITGGMAVIHALSDNTLFLNPTIGISVKNNLDLSVISQVFFQDVAGSYEIAGHFYFGRLKYSF